MNSRPHARLKAWIEAISLVKAIYRETGGFPEQERYGLTGQLRRASVSIPTNIAEGAARHSTPEFLRFLYISRGSLSEIETLLVIATELKFLPEERCKLLFSQCLTIGRLLEGLIKSLRTESVGEDDEIYEPSSE
jgi:four helix bundle protein